MGEMPSNVMYSIHSLISCTVPEPTLPLMYGSQPTWRQNSKNSCVPKVLSSTTPPQCVLTIFLRVSLGPMPSFQ